MKIRTQHLLLTVVGLALVSLGRPAMAVTKTPVTFLASSFINVSPGTVWVSANTFHIRGEMDTGIVTGDLTGTISLVVNRDFNVRPVGGLAGSAERGTFTLTTATVTWVGTFTDSGIAGHGANNLEGHGTDGSTILGKIYGQADGSILIQGTIIAP
jgi:hypothetical protein